MGLDMITTTEKRQAAQREVAIRRNVYAQRVQSGRMKQSVADFEIAVMDAIVEDYRKLEESARWRHKKRGTSYVEVGRGGLQTSDPGGLQDDDVMVIYRGDDGQFHVRAQHEFMDGRFELITEEKAK